MTNIGDVVLESFVIAFQNNLHCVFIDILSLREQDTTENTKIQLIISINASTNMDGPS